MITSTIRFKKTNDKAIVPTYGTEYSAGADMYACIDTPVIIEPGKTVLIPTGLALEIPEGYAGLIYARSGLATKKGIAPANKVSVIDSDYRGEIRIPLHNHSEEAVTIDVAERIAQIIFTPYLKVAFEESDSLSDTERGLGGFGSTGRL
ncbi:MAG: dUTP diphosphatase [Lachnospiraceae bacterium]|nr:dUTP diphosphatase [Lachnospiraceae bacterium]